MSFICCFGSLVGTGCGPTAKRRIYALHVSGSGGIVGCWFTGEELPEEQQESSRGKDGEGVFCRCPVGLWP